MCKNKLLPFQTILALFFLPMFNFSKSSSALAKNHELIEKLKKSKIIHSSLVYDVMRSIDRGDFTSSFYAYYDAPQGIGWGATISAPHMHAWALVEKFLKIRKTTI
jgi:Protein-L-isoaspartate(D-aspartate) O-methyltransferase (PCMT)